MKEKLIKLTKPLLLTCMAWGAWMSIDIASILFFGEYQYPEEK